MILVRQDGVVSFLIAVNARVGFPLDIGAVVYFLFLINYILLELINAQESFSCTAQLPWLQCASTGSKRVKLSIWTKTTRTMIFCGVEMILKMISLKKNRKPPNQKKQSTLVRHQPQKQATMRRMPTQRQKENKLRKL